MAAGGEEIRSAHARDVSLGARIGRQNYREIVTKIRNYRCYA